MPSSGGARAVYLTPGGGALLVIAVVVITSVLLAKHRIALYVPIVGCLLQSTLANLV